ncbi:MAG: ABC transporter ATP-binding protein [Acidimicrobiia bacterium]|nr:ABC transporter ATP-binding protein [Acidimicrobiia bacterium]MYB24313.1 ABC transporter ATP-binding protein [Acidimicrobiia bacterium]MYE68306.1 ABC transporter ATP-binding protein [Acidimicrobiia bacterium]MYJ12889.1 ABC transporter ATP-binding protein [Acidimicrobiia bacterium]
MAQEAVSVIGRNGMGKTTLCNAIMGLLPAMGGSIRFGGTELVGLAPYKVAAAGIGYVPQGRRLFTSLTVDEHLAMLARAARGKRWTPTEVYELFPRLADRKKLSATSLSGGEQQMLAIGRALLLNADLMLMDEPSEGLAPTIVEQLVATSRRLVSEGIAVLLVEQNLSVATAVSDRQVVMVSGRIETEISSEELLGDADAQRRYLGVESLEDAGGIEGTGG